MNSQTVDRAAVLATEERLVNVWPAVSTMLMEGWVVRFAHGYSSRANAASAITPGAGMSAELIEHIEHLYNEAGLVPSVRSTPLCAPEVEPMLLARGYRIKDEAIMMVAPLNGYADAMAHPEIIIGPSPDQRWLSGISDRQEPSKRSADHLLAIVGQIRVPAAFATLVIDGQPVGFAMGALDRGWAEIGSVMLDAQCRGKGFGRLLLTALMGWAAQSGAGRAFLQVSADNAVATGLYRSLGFAELCRYRTLIKT
jgi:N-acetylglutamate synthase